MKSYPLEWPREKQRTPIQNRRNSAFKKTSLDWNRNLASLQNEVDKMGGKDLVLSTNQPVRLDGRPRADSVTVLDPGAALYFTMDDLAVRLACDQWSTVRENIHAITLHLRAMRAIERYGVGNKRQAFSGYAGLMPTRLEDWRVVLGFSAHAAITRQDVEDAYRERAKDVHPDRGGTEAAMTRLNLARDHALHDVRGS